MLGMDYYLLAFGAKSVRNKHMTALESIIDLGYVFLVDESTTSSLTDPLWTFLLAFIGNVNNLKNKTM